jgi:hypothetical protein
LVSLQLAVKTVAGDLAIAHNPVLTVLQLNALTKVGGPTLRIDHNPLLANCVVAKIIAQLAEYIGWTYAVGNDGKGLCGG